MEFLLALGGGWLFSSLLFNGEGRGTFLGVEALVGLKGVVGQLKKQVCGLGH